MDRSVASGPVERGPAVRNTAAAVWEHIEHRARAAVVVVLRRGAVLSAAGPWPEHW